ncbi:MAG: SpoIIE family protein phosphatase [Aeromonas popoffii]|jgi:phosphoserine phosphatase RsbU/P|uniref:SpoIIE family protein phosphatase n=1 Tax=Aeromonas TaxID=642 RepID=UPI0023DD7C86|nr:SpoIIE family protein phosphatase [Aeromonas sp. 1HA1]MDF2415435.1 SpoIIE family protein phosphatase [Aeromonas sp. 1HA1]
MEEWLRSAPATLQSVRELRGRLAQGLALFQVPSQDQANWLLCFSELATNVVRYAEPPAHHLWLTLQQDESGLSLLLDDDGGPQPNLVATQLPDELQEGGYGLALVYRLFDEVSFSHQGNRNRVMLRARGCARQEPVVAVIDDDKVMRTLLTGYLHGQYRVESYADPLAALQALGRQPPALVLSDIEMEGIDGFGLRQQLMKDPKMRGVPFIFLTGHQDQWTQSRAGALGIDDFLTKPITKQALLLAVSRVLQRSVQLKSQWGDQLDQRMTSALRPLLPASRIHGYQLALQTRAAAVGGGDFLLVRERVLWLGDVMGHDAEAKFFAHAYAGYLRGLLTAQSEQCSPARLLTTLSTAVHSDPLLGATLLTTLCIELGEEGWVRWASAGHPAPWLIGTDEMHQLGVTGPLPGLRPDPHFETCEHRLLPGERLLFWTDGLLESRNAVERQQWEAQLQQICLSHEPNLDRLTQRIANWFDDRADSAPDDMTLLLIACPSP